MAEPYTSVKTYERSNRFVIIGENPGGDQSNADADDRRSFPSEVAITDFSQVGEDDGA